MGYINFDKGGPMTSAEKGKATKARNADLKEQKLKEQQDKAQQLKTEQYERAKATRKANVEAKKQQALKAAKVAEKAEIKKISSAKSKEYSIKYSKDLKELNTLSVENKPESAKRIKQLYNKHKEFIEPRRETFKNKVNAQRQIIANDKRELSERKMISKAFQSSMDGEIEKANQERRNTSKNATQILQNELVKARQKEAIEAAKPKPVAKTPDVPTAKPVVKPEPKGFGRTGRTNSFVAKNVAGGLGAYAGANLGYEGAKALGADNTTAGASAIVGGGIGDRLAYRGVEKGAKMLAQKYGKQALDAAGSKLGFWGKTGAVIAGGLIQGSAYGMAPNSGTLWDNVKSGLSEFGDQFNNDPVGTTAKTVLPGGGVGKPDYSAVPKVSPGQRVIDAVRGTNNNSSSSNNKPVTKTSTGSKQQTVGTYNGEPVTTDGKWMYVKRNGKDTPLASSVIDKVIKTQTKKGYNTGNGSPTIPTKVKQAVAKTEAPVVTKSTATPTTVADTTSVSSKAEQMVNSNVYDPRYEPYTTDAKKEVVTETKKDGVKKYGMENALPLLNTVLNSTRNLPSVPTPRLLEEQSQEAMDLSSERAMISNELRNRANSLDGFNNAQRGSAVGKMYDSWIDGQNRISSQENEGNRQERNRVGYLNTQIRNGNANTINQYNQDNLERSLTGQQLKYDSFAKSSDQMMEQRQEMLDREQTKDQYDTMNAMVDKGVLKEADKRIGRKYGEKKLGKKRIGGYLKNY